MARPMEITFWPIEKLIHYVNNPRKNDHVVDKMASFIREYGLKVPIIAKSDGTVIDGHLRLKAASKLNIKSIPVVVADDLTDIQIKAFRLSVNKAAELASWDEELVSLELEALQEADFDIDLTGFDIDDYVTPDFEPATEDDQGKLDELDPIIIKCPHCGEEFDTRKA